MEVSWDAKSQTGMSKHRVENGESTHTKCGKLIPWDRVDNEVHGVECGKCKVPHQRFVVPKRVKRVSREQIEDALLRFRGEIRVLKPAKSVKNDRVGDWDLWNSEYFE